MTALPRQTGQSGPQEVVVNYYAHAIRYLDRPWFVCGVSVPDWLSVVDRRCRVRKRTVLAALPDLNDIEREIAYGILQHLDDDHWFHGTPGFFEVSNELSRQFRAHLGSDERWHCGFLGHIVMELLIDAVLIHRNRAGLEAYYQGFDQVDPGEVARLVTKLATQPADRLEHLIPRFVEERFLDDYLDDDLLLHRLNQVMRRVSLPPLPASLTDALSVGRMLVAERIPELLPTEYFPTLDPAVGSAAELAPPRPSSSESP